MKIIPATDKNFAYAQISDKEYEAIEKRAISELAKMIMLWRKKRRDK